jgi:hypothetical protein
MNQAGLLSAALEYLARGWAVFPLCPPDHGGWVGPDHLETCRRPGKCPVIEWKQYKWRWPDPADLRQWWGWNSCFNIGLALGRVSGLVGIDVDGPAEERTLRKISGGDLPPTLAFGTGGGGRRLLYAVPAGTPCATRAIRTAGKRLHLLGAGSQTVIPPSLHVSGRRYTWEAGFGPAEVAVAPAPAWLLDAFARKDELKRQTGGDGRSVTEEEQRVHRGRTYLRKCDAAIEGQGGDAKTFRIACGLVQAIGLDVDAALALMLEDWNRRCVPPWPEADLRRKLEYAARRQ